MIQSARTIAGEAHALPRTPADYRRLRRQARACQAVTGRTLDKIGIAATAAVAGRFLRWSMMIGAGAGKPS